MTPDAIDQIENKHGADAVREAGLVIAADIKEIVMSRQDLADPDTIGSPLTGTAALTEKTIRRKQKYSNPDLPRYRTGALVDSLFVEYGELTGSVEPLDQEKAYAQQTGTASRNTEDGQMVTPTAPRPFFCVSDRAVKQIEQEILPLIGQRIMAELAGLQLDGQTISIGA